MADDILNLATSEELLYNDVCGIIDGVRAKVATYLNTEICMTNWYVGKRIKEDILYNQRAEYGKLKHCVRSAYLFSEDEIGYAVRSPIDLDSSSFAYGSKR